MNFRVLIVEDDPVISSMTKDYFVSKSSGEMTVETAAGGTEAVEKLNDESFDLVLLDVMLPDIDGFSVCRILRQKSSLSHDLKTPLTIISGSAESLKENVNPEKREFYENAIIENVRYTESIINDALELSRTEKGVLKPVFEKNEISEIIREVCKKYEYLLSEKGISINISGTAVLKCDRRLFSQMLENIISNAVKYSDQSGTVDISLNRNCITVSNTFSGRIDTDIKKLTGPFTRGTKERSGRNGSGLGLAIAKNIADIHRYKICIDVKDKRFLVKIDF